jgi:hypothetical protein
MYFFLLYFSYKQQAGFSFAYWPFSVKLLWAPIGKQPYFVICIQYFFLKIIYLLILLTLLF